MILVFQDDTTVRVIESEREANLLYESVDVENGAYTFLDLRGYLLRPVITRTSRKRAFLVFKVTECVPFTLEPTDERKSDLLTRLRRGEVTIDPRSTKVRSLADLKRVAPELLG